MSIPVLLELLMKEDPSVKATLAGLSSAVKNTLAAGPIQLIPPSQISHLGVAKQLMADMERQSRATAGALVGVRDSLNKALQTPGLGAQVAAYSQIQTELKAIGAASEDVRRINPQLEATYKTLTQSAEDGLERVSQASSTLGGIAQNIAIGFAGVATVFAGLATGSLAIASNFQQLQARLVGVTGSLSEANVKFEEAKAFAATSPFDLAGVVRATATITSFKQSSAELLPVSAALASAFGTDLNEATLAVSKAAAGSTDAFTQLRDTYGITTKALIAAGAAQGKVAGELDHSEKNIDRNRAALLTLINTNFGSAMARQADTLAGAMSNVGDAGETLAAGFGKGLIPLATTGAKALAYMLGIVEAIPEPMKALGVASAVVVGGVAGMGAIAFGSVAAFLALQASLSGTVLQLQRLKIESPQASAALQLLSGAGNRVSGAFTAARLQSMAFLGAFAAVAMVGGVVASSLIDNWQKAEESLGDSITKTSRDFAAANGVFKTGVAALNLAGREAGVTVSILGDAGAQMDQINRALANLPKDQVVHAFESMGISAEQLATDLKSAQGGAATMKERLETLLKVRDQFERVNGNLIQPFDPTDSQRAALQTLKAMGLALSDVDGEVIHTRSEFGRFGNVINLVSKALTDFKQINGPLKEASANSEQLAKFMDLSKQVGTTHALQSALVELNAQVATNASLTKTGASNIDQVYDKLKTAVGAERDLLLKQLDLFQQRDSIMEALAKKEEDGVKRTLEANENAFRRKKLTQDVSLTGEIQHLQERLKLVTKGGEDELKILEEIGAKRKQLAEKLSAQSKKNAEKEASDVKAAFAKVLQGAGQGVADARAGIPGIAPSALSALEDAREKVEAWAHANARLLAKYPEIRAELAKFRSDNAIDTQKAKAEQLKTTLDAVGQDVNSKLSEATNNTAKLAIVNQGLATIQQLRSAGLVKESASQQLVNGLTKQKLSIEQAITAEKAQQQQQIASLEIQAMEQELAILEARKEGGEKVDNEITDNRKAQLNARLALIEQERAAAVEAAQGQADVIEGINKKAALQADHVKGAETLRRLQDFTKMEQAQDKSLSKQEARQQQFQTKTSSPLNQQASAMQFDPFSLGPSFDLSEPLQKMLNPVRTVNRFQQVRDGVKDDTTKRDPSLANSINQAQRQKKLGGNDFLAGQGGGQGGGFGGPGGQGGGGSGSGGGPVTVSIYVNGAKMEVTEPEIDFAVRKVLKRVAGDVKFKGGQ